MSELCTDTVLNMMTATADPEDYTGEDGLLYCGKCRTAKEAYFPKETVAWLGHDKHPTECDCQREKRLEREAAEERRRHLDTVMELKRQGFTDPTMQEWTFAHDNGKSPHRVHWNTAERAAPVVITPIIPISGRLTQSSISLNARNIWGIR